MPKASSLAKSSEQIQDNCRYFHTVPMSLQSPPKRSHTNRFEDKPSNLTGHIPQCTFCNQHQNQNGIAHPWNNLSQEVLGVWASHGQRGHQGDSRRSCRDKTFSTFHCWNQALKGKTSLSSSTLGICQLVQQVPRNIVLRFLLLFNLSFTFANSRKVNQAQRWDIGNLWQLYSCH